jgi:hypothetical protein
MTMNKAEPKAGIGDLSLSRDGKVYAIIPSGHYLEVIGEDGTEKFVLRYPSRFNEYLVEEQSSEPQ